MITLDLIGSGVADLVGDVGESEPDGQIRFEPGDVLFSKLRPYLAKSLLVPLPAHGTGELLALCPRLDALEPRYLLYLTLSAPWLDRAVMTSYGTKMPRTSWEAMSDFVIPVLDVADQRRIADFLDDQTARMEKVAWARSAQLRLVDEEYGSAIDELMSGPVTRPLDTITDERRPIQYGIVLPGPDYPGGVPIVKGGDVGSGRVASGDLNRTDPAIEAKYVRSRLTGGDLVISIRGSVGEIAVVPPFLAGANLTQDAARIAVKYADPDWVRLVLATPTVQSDMRARVTGAMVPGLNIEALRAVRVPHVSPVVQREVAKVAASMEAQVREQRSALRRSTQLLNEFRSSLITAAVTGEFDVTTASRNLVPA